MLLWQQDIATASDPPPNLNEQVTSDPFTHSLPEVEAYLDSICGPIASALDKSHNSEARNEMRVHIESLIESNVELGNSKNQAVVRALKQFGKAQTVEQAWKRELPTEDTGSILKSVGIAFALNSLAVMLLIKISWICCSVKHADTIVWHAATAIKSYGLLATPAAAGLVTGVRAKCRPTLVTLYSILLLLIPMTFFGVWKAAPGAGHPEWHPGTAAMMAVFLEVWVPPVCAGAGVCELIRWFKQHHRQTAIAR